MGEVFAAENLRTGRVVALKLLRDDTRQKSSAVARFRREARAAGSINSDHVTQVLDVEDDPEHGIVLVFEMLQGESLIERLKRTGPIAFDELYGIVEEVWMGLGAAHAAGVIHRDLKPSNVFLEQRPDGRVRVKILDFGISKVPKDMESETLTEIGQSLGTFSFMPPEQMGRAKVVDHRADIYACATLIYQSMSGQLPYIATSIVGLMQLKNSRPARTLAEAMGEPVDPKLEAFVARGLAQKPEDRFMSADEALAAWRQLDPSTPRSGQPIPLAPDEDEESQLARTQVMQSPFTKPQTGLATFTDTPHKAQSASQRPPSGPRGTLMMEKSGNYDKQMAEFRAAVSKADALAKSQPSPAAVSARAPSVPQPPAPSPAHAPLPYQPPASAYPPAPIYAEQSTAAPPSSQQLTGIYRGKQLQLAVANPPTADDVRPPRRPGFVLRFMIGAVIMLAIGFGLVTIALRYLQNPF